MIEKFSEIKVLIAGDLMLDRYCWGSVSRISPEAPVPVVSLEKTSLSPGGAANVAVNIAGFGAEARLLGIIGDDNDGIELISALENEKVDAEYLLKDKERHTTVKTRIVAHNQHVVRLDQESSRRISAESENVVINQIDGLIESADIIILSDYAKGFLTDKVIKRILDSSLAGGKKVIIDPKGKDFSKYSYATAITPNKREAFEATGIPDTRESGKALMEKLNLEALLITEGEDGMTLFEKGVEPLKLSSLARTVYDVTGAGDTVIAAFAVAIAAGLSFAEAAGLANRAAGLVVENVGTTPIRQEMLSSLR